jgi:methyltransferase
MIGFYLFMGFVIFQRLLELVVARRNESWALAQGAVEYGQNHYPFIVMLHTLLIAAMFAEFWLKGGAFSFVFLMIFLVLISL